MRELHTMLELPAGAFFAFNMGASIATSMSAAYGAGAVSRRLALTLAAASALAGAVAGGAPVARTLAASVVSSSALTPPAAAAVLGAAGAALLVGSLRGVPLSTSHVTVGALVGLGLATGRLVTGRLALIAAAWVALPALAFGLVVAAGRLRVWLPSRMPAWAGGLPSGAAPGRLARILQAGLVAAGAYQAFAGGTNNAGNVAGPLAGAGALALPAALAYSGLWMAAGALAAGGRVLETAGRGITRLSLAGAAAALMVSGSLGLAASALGLPVALNHITTAAIMGVGAGRSSPNPADSLNRRAVRHILALWLLSPVVSAATAYALVRWAQPQLSQISLGGM